MDSQNLTKGSDETPTAQKSVSYETLDTAKQALVDYRALSGYIATDDNELGLKRMSVDDLAGKLGVVRQTIYDWQNSIPNFWGIVNARRAVISSESRLAAIEKVWLAKALKGEWQHLNAWLLNYKPGYKTPTAKIEHEVGATLADLFRGVAAQHTNVIDAEVTISEPQQQLND